MGAAVANTATAAIVHTRPKESILTMLLGGKEGVDGRHNHNIPTGLFGPNSCFL